jgi:hypothetical protein
VVTRTFTVFAASYDALGAAEADCQAVHEFYMVTGLLDKTGGTGLGALAGHVSAGLGRAGLKELGEVLRPSGRARRAMTW